MCIDISGQLTVYFDCPFWVGVFEIYSDNAIATCKVVFGSEPKDSEIYSMIINDYYSLKFSKPMAIDSNYKKPQQINPKRLQRQIKEQIVKKGVGTKAQQAMQIQRETNAVQRKRISKEQKDSEKQLKFKLEQHRKKQKHKGH